MIIQGTKKRSRGINKTTDTRDRSMLTIQQSRNFHKMYRREGITRGGIIEKEEKSQNSREAVRIEQ